MLDNMLSGITEFLEQIESSPVVFVIIACFVLAVGATLIAQTISNRGTRLFIIAIMAAGLYLVAKAHSPILNGLANLDRIFSLNLSTEFAIGLLTYIVYLTWEDGKNLFVSLIFAIILLIAVYGMFFGYPMTDISPLIDQNAHTHGIWIEFFVSMLVILALIIYSAIIHTIAPHIITDEIFGLLLIIVASFVLGIVTLSDSLVDWLTEDAIRLTVFGSMLTGAVLSAWVTSSKTDYRLAVIVLLVASGIILYALVSKNQGFAISVGAEIVSSVVAAILIDGSPL